MKLVNTSQLAAEIDSSSIRYLEALLRGYSFKGYQERFTDPKPGWKPSQK